MLTSLSELFCEGTNWNVVRKPVSKHPVLQEKLSLYGKILSKLNKQDSIQFYVSIPLLGFTMSQTRVSYRSIRRQSGWRKKIFTTSTKGFDSSLKSVMRTNSPSAFLCLIDMATQIQTQQKCWVNRKQEAESRQEMRNDRWRFIR